jgi:hypothetical protein
MGYPLSLCQPAQVPGLRVHPPEECDALYVAVALDVCSINGIGVPVVYPVMSR